MALNTVSSDRLSTNVKNTNFTAAEKQDLTDDIKPLLGSSGGGSKNLIINGAMQVAQRGTVTGITSSTYAGPDRFRFGVGSHGTFTVSQDGSAPTGSGFANSLKLDCTTADTSVASGTAVYFQHKLEGQDCQRIKKGTSSAEQLAVQFHVKSNKTGTYAFQLSDNDNSRSFTTTYSISSADTWEKKTIIIPADTTGALDDDNNVSLTFNFWLVAGTDYTSGAASTTWYSHVNANAAKGHAVNIADSTSNEWYMTGFQVETGSVHTDFEHRSFHDEMQRCRRYYLRLIDGTQQAVANFTGFTATSGYSMITAPVQMRSTPTLVQSTGTDYYRALFVNGQTDFFDGFYAVWKAHKNIITISVDGQNISHGPTASFFVNSNNASASLAFNSEL
tara:strand:+ start:5 stop:1174 length:1170 start_codon:yes stop_codon:yes gene_type:complete